MYNTESGVAATPPVQDASVIRGPGFSHWKQKERGERHVNALYNAGNELASRLSKIVHDGRLELNRESPAVAAVSRGNHEGIFGVCAAQSDVAFTRDVAQIGDRLNVGTGQKTDLG